MPLCARVEGAGGAGGVLWQCDPSECDPSVCDRGADQTLGRESAAGVANQKRPILCAQADVRCAHMRMHTRAMRRRAKREGNVEQR